MSQSIRITSAETPGAYRVVGIEEYRTIEMGDLTGTARIVPEEISEFVLRLGSPGDSAPSVEISAADCRLVGEEGDDRHAVLRFECAQHGLSIAAHFSAGPGPRLRKWLTLRNTADNPVVIFDVVLEKFRLGPGVCAWGGGRGWPIFVGGLGYFAIEHPEAENLLTDTTCVLEYYPAVTIEAGDCYDTERALLEFAPDNPEEALRRYTDEFRIRKPGKLFTCYGTLGAHEYEGPGEESIRRQVDALVDLRSHWHIPIDYFLLDFGYWRDGEDPCRTGAYVVDTDRRFPGSSFDDMVSSLSAAKIGLGMWFGVSQVENDEFALNMKSSIAEMRSRYGLKLIKADASCAPDGTYAVPEKYMRYRTARLLMDIFGSVRSSAPDMVIMAAGFARSPWWLAHVHLTGTGDASQSDVPAPSLRDSQILQADLDHRFFEQDAGTAIGFSDAGFWLGTRFMRESVIMSVSRSNQLYLYGDLGVLGDDDRLFIQRLVQYHSTGKHAFGHAVRILGRPEDGEIYGYANMVDGHGFVALVNPSWISRTLELHAFDVGADPEVRNMVIEVFPSTQAASILEWESCDLRFNPWEIKLLEIAPSEQHYELFESRVENAGRYPMPITSISLPADVPECMSLPLERVFYRTGSSFRCRQVIPREWEGYPVLVDLRGLQGELYISNRPTGIFGGSFRLFYPGTREYGRLDFGQPNLLYVAVDDPDIVEQPDLIIRPLGYGSSSTCREDWPHAKVSSMVLIVRLKHDGAPVRPTTDPRMAQCAVWLDGIWMEPYRVPALVPRIWSGYSWAVFALDLEGDWECARVIVPHLLNADYDIEFFLTDRVPAIAAAD